MIWISGTSELSHDGIYGEKGIPNPNNVPRARNGAVSWIDSDNNLYLFGGSGIYKGFSASYNDLWKFDGTNWTWISGSNEANQLGIYGEKGIPDPNNVPGARTGAVSWTDSSNNLYLFGGGSNDLWKFDGTYWVWIAGSNETNQVGVYGTIGIPSANNVPGARRYAVSWIDSSDNLYLFGGRWPSYATVDLFNDLWKFDGTNWTWISGSSEMNQPGIYGEKGVLDLNNIPGARSAAVSWIDSENNLYLFGGLGYAATSYGLLNDLWKFDGANWIWISGFYESKQVGNYGAVGIANPNNVPGARYDAVSWIDSENNLYLFGGFGYATSTTSGYLGDLWKFDGTNWVWIYGSNEIDYPGIYGEKGIPNPDNTPRGRSNAVSWIDSSDNLYFFGGCGFDDGESDGELNDLWVYTSVCFGLLSTNPQVCSGRGECIEDICKCRKNWFGAQCNITHCFGILANESNVCNGRGICSNPNVCECEENWFGDQCEITHCFGFLGNDSQVCSGRGTCVDTNICDCEIGWGGNCSVPYCYGIASTNKTFVCSGHGTCTSVDTCICEENWFGNQCEFTHCFGFLGNDSNVCNGNGKCIDPNVCECEEGWESSSCSIPLCFGKSATDKLVCSGRGTCIGKDQCKCNSKYMGKECTKKRLIVVYAAANIHPSWNWLILLILVLLMFA